MEFIFNNERIDENKLNQQPWLKFLYLTKEHHANPERTEKMAVLLRDNLVLDYVERTLLILQSHHELTSEEFHIVETVLKWSEVAKAGMPLQRRKWQSDGLVLEIHNEASAQIYLQNQTEDRDEKTIHLIYTLIDTHGLLGQYIRGENNFSVHQPLSDLLKQGNVEPKSLKRMLMALNHCVMAAANENIWIEHQDEVGRLIDVICEGDLENENKDAFTRLKQLFPIFTHNNHFAKEEQELYQSIFAQCDLWYSEAALESFSRNEINTIFTLISKELKTNPSLCHISFYPLAQNLLYDYQGRKKVNVYKKRICELCFKELAEQSDDQNFKEHVSIKMDIKANTLYFDVCFTPVCAALINFCEEAEKSHLISYEKNIQNIFDLFGFRRDIFDRLNNEEVYLSTMNDAATTSKTMLLDYICGESAVDVGSGGGVLLDKLEQRYPKLSIIGTDISVNVIEALQKKIRDEGHHYQVIRHNFVEGKLDRCVDNIIFSSIIHEIYSYTSFEGKRFQIQSVKQALKNAVDSLNVNGRLIIRDGIRCDDNRVASVRFKEESGVAFCKNYLKDFEGLADCRDEEGKQWDSQRVSLNQDVLSGPRDLLREALYTYTWGSDSYSQEVQEQFGYFTLHQYCDFLKLLNMRILLAKRFTENGYPQHLNPLVELVEPLSWDDLPSTCILIAEKRGD